MINSFNSIMDSYIYIYTLYTIYSIWIVIVITVIVTLIIFQYPLLNGDDTMNSHEIMNTICIE